MAHFLSCGENVSNLTIVASSFATLALARIGRWRPAPYVRFGSGAIAAPAPESGSSIIYHHPSARPPTATRNMPINAVPAPLTLVLTRDIGVEK